MNFNLETLTDAELAECKQVAVERTKVQVQDANNGMASAAYSYGRRDFVQTRSFEQRINDHIMGAIAELIASKCSKCKWTKEMNQYKSNSNPDLRPTFRKQVVKCDVRGTKKYSTFIYRPRDTKNPDFLLIAVSNLPEGPDCQVGHSFFRDIAKLAEDRPEWLGSHPGEPYYEIPFKFLSGDFSEFGG
jgi:hypothetical protein